MSGTTIAVIVGLILMAIFAIGDAIIKAASQAGVRGQASQLLHSGTAPFEVLKELLTQFGWSKDVFREISNRIIIGEEYREIVNSTSESHRLDILTSAHYYKQVFDVVNDTKSRVREAMNQQEVPQSLPSYRHPAVRVVSQDSQFFSAFKPQDLICVYDGRLICTLEELRAEQRKTSPDKEVVLGVLRYDQTNKGSAGWANMNAEYAWVSLTLSRKGGEIKAQLETNDPLPTGGSQDGAKTRPQASLPLTPSVESEAAEPYFIRFVCPGCGKRLKSTAGTEGKKSRCPKCQSSMRIPADRS